MTILARFGLAAENRPEVGVQHLDARQEVERPHVLLVGRIVADGDTQRQAVVVDGRAEGTRTVADRSQTTNRERDRVRVDAEVVGTSRTDVHRGIIDDGRGQSAIQGDPGRPAHLDDGVAVGGRRTEGHELADARSNGEAVNDDLLAPTSRVTCEQVDRTRREDVDRIVVSRSPAETVAEGDGGRRGGARASRHLVRDATDVDPRANGDFARAGVHRDGRVAHVVTGRVVDLEGPAGHTARDVGHVQVFVEVKAELVAQLRIPETFGVTTLVGRREPFRPQHVTFRLGGEDQVAVFLVALGVVHHLPQVNDVVLDVAGGDAVQVARDVREELRVLTEDDLIDHAGQSHCRRTSVLIRKLLHGHRVLDVVDGEADVVPLVEDHLDVVSHRILHGDRVALHLPLAGEFTRPTGVDGIAELVEVLLEVAIDESRRHHVLFQNGEGLVRPPLRDVRVDVVVEVRLGLQVEAFHCSLFR